MKRHFQNLVGGAKNIGPVISNTVVWLGTGFRFLLSFALFIIVQIIPFLHIRHISHPAQEEQEARISPTAIATTRSKITVNEKVSTSTVTSLFGDVFIISANVRHPLML